MPVKPFNTSNTKEILNTITICPQKSISGFTNITSKERLGTPERDREVTKTLERNETRCKNLDFSLPLVPNKKIIF